MALAAVALGHWFVAKRQLAISGRFTGIVNRLRHGPEDRSIETVAQDDLLAALRAATAVEFGAASIEPVTSAKVEPPVDSGAPKSELVRKRLTTFDHVAFLIALVVGGFLARFTAGERPAPNALLDDAFGQYPWVMPAMFLLGGMLVGFGTRMAGGCTSGHGLCGVSRFQKGSLVATVAFFGFGVVVSFALGAVL
jgi:uncharacterized protein